MVVVERILTDTKHGCDIIGDEERIDGNGSCLFTAMWMGFCWALFAGQLDLGQFWADAEVNVKALREAVLATYLSRDERDKMILETAYKNDRIGRSKVVENSDGSKSTVIVEGDHAKTLKKHLMNISSKSDEWGGEIEITLLVTFFREVVGRRFTELGLWNPKVLVFKNDVYSNEIYEFPGDEFNYRVDRPIVLLHDGNHYNVLLPTRISPSD